MTRFRFGLERVLDVRKREEGGHQRIVAEVEGERLALEQRLRGCQQIIQAEKDAWRTEVSGGGQVDVRNARFQAGASLRAVGEAQRLAIQLAGVLKRLERARAELNKAAAARRAVEILRERAFEAWQSQERRREDSEMDDLMVMRYGTGEGRGEGEVA